MLAKVGTTAVTVIQAKSSNGSPRGTFQSHLRVAFFPFALTPTHECVGFESAGGGYSERLGVQVNINGRQVQNEILCCDPKFTDAWRLWWRG